MSERLVELKIKSLSIVNRGSFKGKNDVNAISFTLTYPREGIPTINTVKEFSINKPIPTNFPTLNYDQSIVFKEKICGESQLTIEVAAIDNPSKLDKFFASLFKGVFKAMFGQATGGISNVALAAVSTTIGESIFDKIEAKESIQKIGRVVIPIKPEDLCGDGDIEKILKVPANVIEMIEGEDEDDDGDVEVIEQVVLKKGETNGTIVLSYKKL